MSPRFLLRCLITALVLCLNFTVGLSQDVPTLIAFKSEADQISFTLRKEFHPAIAEMLLQVFTPDIKEVYRQQIPANQPLVWQMKDSSGKPAQEPVYLCAIGLKPASGAPYFLTGRISLINDKYEFSFLEERPNNIPGPSPEEFHKSLTVAMPESGAAWFFYGLAICDKHRDSFGNLAISLAPPPPPPAAPPPAGVVIKEIPVSKEDSKQIAEEEKQWKAKQAALQKDLKVAKPFFLKAAELADDCQIKDTAMAYLAGIAGEFEDEEQERQWLFKRIESPCATNSVKAESYYALGVKQWQCAWELTSKYANKKAADPFHFRAITNPADKQKLDNCITTAAELVEKAIAADPKFPEAWFYKSLIFREKQKVTANAIERKKFDEEANKTKDRGMELMKQLEQRR